MQPNAYFMSAKGGTVEFLTEDGEVIAAVDVPAGRVPVRHYLVPAFTHFKLSRGLAVVLPRPVGGVVGFGDAAYQSGANPDYRPTPASQMEKRLRLLTQSVQQSADRIEARAKQLARAERQLKRRQREEPALEVIEAERPDPVQDDGSAAE